MLMGKKTFALRFLLALILAIGLWSCGSTDDGGVDEDSNLVSEIDEATEDISEEEGGDEEELLSEGDDEEAEEEFEEEYAEGDQEEGAEEGDEDSEEFAEGGEEEGDEVGDDEGEEFADEDFDDEDFEDEDGQEDVAEGGGDEDFEDFEDEEGADREVAQEGEGQNDEPQLEALDGSSEDAFNEPPAEGEASNVAAADVTAEEVGGGEGGDYPDAQVENPDELAGAPMDVAADEGDYGEEPAQSWIPVKKIKDAPFYRNGRLLNTVYIFRNDTDLASVSTKIYGEDRSDMLLQDNPHLGRGADPGDKLYYNSPNRPDDSAEMKVVYEDVGAVAQEYVTQVGDNIRNFSSQLLGFPDAWKEVWATNMEVDSKGEVAEGLTLKYWKDDIGSLNTNLADNQKQPELDSGMSGVANDFNSDFAGGGAPPPPPPGGPDLEGDLANMASTTAPPPPPPPMGGGAEMAPPPPPPPPVAGGTGTPPPPLPGAEAGAADPAGGGGIGAVAGDSSTLIYVALGLLAAVALFIKKKKSARAPSVFEATQV